MIKFIKAHPWKFALWVALLVWLTVGVFRCENESYYVEYKLDEPNETEYIFNFPADEVERAIYYGFNNNYAFKNYSLSSFVEGSYSYLLSYRQYALSYTHRKRRAGRSDCFRIKVIFLDPINDSTTLCRVKYSKGSVVSGIEFFTNIFFLNYMPEHKKIKTNTIEEYEMLRYIGKILGVIDSMPLVKYPRELTDEQILETFGLPNPFTAEEMFGIGAIHINAK